MRKIMRGNAVNCGSYAKIMRSFAKTKNLESFDWRKRKTMKNIIVAIFVHKKIVFFGFTGIIEY